MPHSVNMLLSAIFLAVGAIFWLIALAGVSALQDRCQGNCNTREEFGLTWWVIFLEVIVLVVAALATLTRLAVRPAALTLLAVAAVLTMLQANDALNLKDANAGSDLYNRASCAAAGFVVLSIINMLLIITLGTEMEQIVATGPRTGATPAGQVQMQSTPGQMNKGAPGYA